MASLKEVSINGAKWMTISTIVSTLVTILRLAILTRILDKSDFGIVAILSFVLGLTSTFSNMGFSTVIMHKQDLTDKQFSSLFWIQMAIYAILYLIVICFTHPIAIFYNEPLLHKLLPLSLLDLLFMGIGKLYETVLQKNFQFKLIAFRTIISSILSLALAVIMAMLGFGVYTLVISTLFASIFLAVWNFVLGQRQIRLRLTCSVMENIPLMKIGLYQTGTQFVDYFCTKLDVLIIGKFLGMDMLGVYNLSKELIHKAMTLINTIVNRVLAPAFSKIQNDRERMSNTYCDVLRKLTCITFPVIMLLGAMAIQITDVLYGGEYIMAGQLTAILSLWCAMCAIGNPVSNIIIATGRTDLTFKYVWVRTLFTLPVVYVCSTISIQTVAWGQVALAVLMFFCMWFMQVKPILSLSISRLAGSFMKQGCLALCIGSVAYFYFSTNPWGLYPSIFQLLIYTPVIASIYFMLFSLLMKSEMSELMELVVKILKK